MPRIRAILTLLAILSCGVVYAQKPMVVHPVPSDYPTGYLAWIADATSTAKYHGARWYAGTYSATIDDAIIYGQYS